MSEQREDEEEKGFSVDDRRRFELDGSPREGAEVAAAGHGGSSARGSAEDRGDGEGAARGKLPEIDFSTFILSLSTSAIVHLGEAPHPDGVTRKDLTLARQTIDLLALLKEKTQGNLSQEESKLLNDLLYDMRLRFVAASK